MAHPEVRGKTLTLSMSRSGFTLIELLMVVVLLGLVAAFAGQNFASTLGSTRLDQSVRELYQAARYAKIIAVESQSVTQLKLNRETGEITLLGAGDSDNGVAKLGDAFFKPVSLETGVRFLNISVDAIRGTTAATASNSIETIRFYSDGATDGAWIALSDERQERIRSLSITPLTGRMEVLEGSVQPESTRIDLDEL